MNTSQSLAPLRNREFRWYFASRFVNSLGAMMAPIALTFAVLDISRSPSALGTVLAAHTVPMVVLLLWGGVISDHFPRTVVLQVSNVTSALLQGVIAALVLTDVAQLWMLVVLSAAHGATSAISFPAMASMVVQMVPREQWQPANTLLSLTRNGLTVIGPTLGALIVVAAGSGWALAVDALTWLLAALFLLPIELPARERSGPVGSTWSELGEGWTFFRSTTWLWVVVLGFGFLNMIHTGAWFTLGPVVAEDTIGRQGWGYVLSAEALGLFVMGLVFLRVRLERPLLWGMVCVAAMALPLLALGLEPRLGILLVAAFASGAGVEVFALGWNLAMQENIDEQMLSRAYSYDALGSFVAMPVGQIAWGPLGEWFGYEAVLVASGVAYVVVCAAVLLNRSVRTLPRRDHLSTA